ncbi:MAG: sel1 repeat family protein, partial [Clostridiales bacterium]|jgi:hypothetical protein|nr:sel1 repeat family protein [Clostridiales bacterium]
MAKKEKYPLKMADGAQAKNLEERRARLKAFTADDKILAAVGNVAFSQEELDVLLADGANPIYLCGRQFNVSESKGGITYIGIGSPTVTPPATFVSQGIILKSVEIEPACIVQCAYATEDLDARANLWRMAADKGEMQAQYRLGKCYECGLGVKMDAGEAARWYRKSADQGHAAAQYNLGRLYRNGQGLEQSYEDASKWYRKAAVQGSAYAQNSLGNLYNNGQGVEQSYEEAAKWYRKAAEQGDSYAQYLLGYQYYQGRGVEQSDEEAAKWYLKAKQGGTTFFQPDEEAFVDAMERLLNADVDVD